MTESDKALLIRAQGWVDGMSVPVDDLWRLVHLLAADLYERKGRDDRRSGKPMFDNAPVLEGDWQYGETLVADPRVVK